MKLVLIVMLLSMVGCGAFKRGLSKFTGGGSETCMDGVVYYQFTSGSAVAYNRNGTIKLCD